MIYPIPRDTLQSGALLEDGLWEIGPMRGKEDREVRWFKLAAIGSKRIKLGLSDDGYWVRGGGATVEVANGPNIVTFLPCLELSFEELRQAGRKGLAQAQLSASVGDTFPFSDLIVAGLESGSEYWVTLALDRIEEGVRDGQVDEAIRSAAISAPTQRLRHRSKALLGKSVH